MGHAHPHPHGASHPHAPTVNALRLAFFLNLAFTIVEAIGGWLTNSIAVLTDAVHDLGDSLVLGAAWYLQGVATRGRDTRYSYGYARYSMLGGWLASVILIVGALFMFTVSIPRLFTPVEPHALGMMGIAVFGLVMNGLAAWRLHGGITLNERGAYLHLLEDVLGWAAVLVGAVVIHYTGWAVLDPLMSMGISLYILFNAIGTLRKGTAILMQAQPAGIDAQELEAALTAIPGVRALADMHTWSLDGRLVVASVHLEVEAIAMDEARAIKTEARSILHAQGIHHATIELQWPDESVHLPHR